MTNLELAQKALDVYANRDYWTYVQGGLGELSITNRIKGLYNYYRGKGNGSTCDYPVWLEQYGKYNGQAKQCTDCSNFIQYLINSGKNASASYYNKMKAIADIYTAPVGSILLIPNKHVGIVVTQGIRNNDGTWKVLPESLDFYAYNNTCRKMTYVGSSFTKAVYLDGIDYIDTPSSTVYPIKVDASVSGTHYVGETLQAKDFTVKVTMSDGNVLTNPANWYATPLKLTSTINKITVGYQGVTTIIVVQAIGDEAIPQSMTATVNGTHLLGDTLEAKDFTIKVQYSDGSVKTNPNGWTAWPLKLTDNVTDIVVKFENVSCVLKVNFFATIK